MASIIFAVTGIIFAICGYFYADHWKKQHKKNIPVVTAGELNIKPLGQIEILQEEDTTEKEFFRGLKVNPETEYIIDKMLYSIPPETEIEYIKRVCEYDFDQPENLLDTWLRWGILYGPKLIEPMLAHFRTLSNPDMPENYVEDIINEFIERFNMELFIIQNRRFKLIKKHDRVAREFSKEIEVRNGLTIDDIDSMSGIEFEYFLHRLFIFDGYDAKLTKASNDQGADLILTKNGESTVVQAKRYLGAVSNSAVQEVFAAKAYYRCEHAIVITNSYFTKSAINLALSNKVTLLDREKLKEKLDEYNDYLSSQNEV